FVRSASDSVDMAYRMEANALYIHEKWLHVRGADGPATEGAIRSERDVFLCQYLAEELYRRAVTLIVHKTDGLRTSQTIQPLLQAAHWKLHEMPRRIEVYAAAAADDGPRATQVSFYTGHSLLFTKLCGTRVSYLVVLHGPNCVAQSVDHLLYDPSRDCCLCPRQVVPLSMRRAVFEDPGHGPWVPMVVKMSVRDGLVGAMSSSGGHDWPLLPKAQDGALVAIAPPSSSPSSETAAPRGTVPVDRPSTVSAALDPVPTTPTAATQEDQDTTAASQLAAGPLELGTGAQTTASDTASDTAAPVPLVSVVECLAPHPDDHPESASGALPSTISRNMTSADGAWWQTWPEPPRDVQTSPSAADLNIGRFQVQESHRSCEPPQGLSKGQYARVQLREPGGDGTTTGRYVLYVHDVLPPTLSHGPGARLVVTKYSFLADRLAWEAGHPDTQAQELLLHFRDADRIGYPDDAEIINADTVVAVDSMDTEPVGPTVSYVAQVPDPANGLFVRYGIREGSQREWLFLAPLVSSLTGPRGSAAYPRFSPLPVASVFDLSPDDLRLSVGFQKAGYCVQAAVGFAEDRHQAWKTQHPDATVYPGCVASALATMDYDLSTQPDDRGRDVPRIVTISGEGSFAKSAAGWLDPSSSGFDGFDGLSGETLSPLQQCELAAQSPGLSPDFIVLMMSRSILTDQSWGSLARTMGLLLEQGYAVALRPVSLPDPGQHGERSVLLLAAPGRTDPQWIDDTLSDLRMVSASDELLERAENESGVSSVPAADGVAAAGSAGGGDAGPPSDSTPRRGDSVLTDGAQHIAATVSRIIGEFSTKCALTTNLPRLVVTDNSDGAQDRAKRQRM
ncbi:hypothetical protein C8Q69DRAFT_383279, partial [Paecilomyces variotii]